MKLTRISKLGRSSRGQSLVEFALVLPLMLVVAFIITEFGRALWTQNVLTEAAGNAARAAIVSNSANYQAAATAAANRILDANGMGTTAKSNPSTVTATLEVDPGTNTQVVRVRITRSFSFIPGKEGGLLPTTPGAGKNASIQLNGFTIAGESVMDTQPTFS